MKNNLLILIIAFTTVLASAQNKTKEKFLRVKLKKESIKSYQIDNKDYKANDFIKPFLVNHEIIDIKPSFPGAKNPILQDLYLVTCSSDSLNSLKRKLTKEKSILQVSDLNNEIYTTAEPSDYFYSLGWQWSLDQVHALDAWDITTGSSNVKIAIIDSDFDITHPDLSSKFLLNTDPFTGIAHTQIQNSIGSHGTGVASVAIAETDGGGQMASIGHDIRFYGYTFSTALEKAWHASFTLGVDVISISFFYSCSYDDTASAALHEIIDNGTIIVAAAGNGNQHCGGQDVCPFCALNDDRIIKVTTTGHNDEHTLYTPDGTNTTDSHFPAVDICAPGEDIMVAMPTGGSSWPYFGSSGQTSIATPQVAATCALMRSVNRCISPEEAEDVLRNTADLITDEYLYSGLLGGGRLNVYQAVLGAIEAGTVHRDGLNITGTNTYPVALYVSSSNTTVKSAANVIFQAEREITLGSEFTVELGATFTTSFSTYTCP